MSDENRLVLYEKIIDRYYKGEFGNQTLSLHNILQEAGEPDLLRKMSLEELQILADKSFGVTKQIFLLMIQKRKKDGV